jgi:hypothetical protein
MSNSEYTLPFRSRRAGGTFPFHSSTRRCCAVTPSRSAASEMCIWHCICEKSRHGGIIVHGKSSCEACTTVHDCSRRAIFIRKTPTKDEFNNLFDSEAELFGGTFVWPPADGYTIWRGVIYPLSGRPRMGFPPPNPFARTDLFHSFARLGARGKPSESRIKEWVSQNGLLTRKDETLSGTAVLEDGTVNQQPISVEDFRSEVSRARAMLELYAEIRRRDTLAIDARIAQPQSLVDKELASYFSDDRSWRRRLDLLMAYAGGVAINVVLGVADKVLAEMLSQSVAHVRPRAIKGFEAPMRATTKEELRSYYLAANNNYRMQQGWHYPDLRSAIYMQFYMLVTQNRPMRLCENPRCKMPFPATKRNRRFCCDTCRSNARRYR